MKKKISLILLVFLLLLGLVSCAEFPIDLNSGSANGQTKTELSTETVYNMAKDAGYTGSLSEFIAEFKGADGKDGEDGKDGVGITSAAFDEDGHLILSLTNGKSVDCGKVTVNVSSSSSISIGSNGNWYIDGEDTGKRAEGRNGTVWHTGTSNPTVTVGTDGDLYLNTITCDVFKKTGTKWTLIANIGGDGTVIEEGDSYDITINGGDTDKHAAAKALLSAVRVECVFTQRLSSYQYVSNGSGVIYKLDKTLGDAYIITNYHVVFDADANTSNKISSDIGLYLYGMEQPAYRISAEYVGGSMTYDIAVLKVTANEILRTGNVRAAEVADSEKVRVLDTAIAIGNPASNGLSVTKGSVSVESEFISMLAPDEITTNEHRVMRIDTPVNSGNSGGGLFNSEGKLIGIVSAKEKDTSYENMGYAIPSNLAVAVAENILRNCDGATNEQAIKCRLGISIAIGNAWTEYDTEAGVVNRKQTCVVNSIEAGSVAEVVLMVDDVIKSFEIDGVTYDLNYYYSGSEILLYADLGSSLFVNIERDGEAVRVELPIDENNFSHIQ